MIPALIVAILCASGVGSRPPVRCDLIEFNTIGPSLYKQVIFWRWNAHYQRYEVRSWLPDDRVEIIDSRTVRVRGYTVVGPTRFSETDYDPERCNLKLCGSEHRVPMPWDEPPPIHASPCGPEWLHP